MELARLHGLSLADLDRTFLVVDQGEALTKSDAGLAILRQLRAPWSWGQILRAVPRPVRDGIYSWVARNRYRWFGQRDQCFIAPAGQAHRFVSGPPRSQL